MVMDDHSPASPSRGEGPSGATRTVLGPACRLSGELTLEGDALLLGHFSGTLRVSGTLEVGPTGEARGALRVGRLLLAGSVDAEVVAAEETELLRGGRLGGKLYTPKLGLASGSRFEAEGVVGPHAVATFDAAPPAVAAVHESGADEPAPLMGELDTAEDDDALGPLPLALAFDALAPREAPAAAAEPPAAASEPFIAAPPTAPAAAEVAPPLTIRTLPNSVQGLLQRRRAKVLVGGGYQSGRPRAATADDLPRLTG